MKLLCFIALTVSVVSQAANIQEEILPPGISVTKDLERSHYALSLLARDYAEIKHVSPVSIIEKSETRLVTDAIEDILEGLRTVILNGNDNVPVLDPYIIPQLGPYEYRITGVVADATVNNLRAEGLGWFVADHITVNPLRLTLGITLTVPWLTVTGSYNANARIALLSHRASGNIRIFAHRIEVNIDMRMGTNLLGGHLVLRSLDIGIDIHDTQVSITGMTGSVLINNFISATIQNVSQDVIQNELENVGRILSEELFDVIDDVLKGYSVSDIFG